MNRPSRQLFRMGPLYEIMRDGHCVATTHGLPDGENEIDFQHDTDVRVGDVVVGKVSREEFTVGKVSPEVSGETVMVIKAFRKVEKRDDHSRSHVTQHIGIVHGSVAGRDLHGDTTVTLTIGDVLNYLRYETEKSASADEKKSLLAKLGELTKHPIVVNLASLAVSQLVKPPGTP